MAVHLARKSLVPLTAFATFWMVSLALAVVPGADWAYAISAGLKGRSKAVAAVLGLVAGCLLAAMVVAAGIGALVSRHPSMLHAMTFAGAGYLLMLGIKLLRSPGSRLSAGQSVSQDVWRWLLKGSCVSGLNPKLLLLFLALLPQFVTTAGPWPVAGQIMLLGIAHAFNCLVIYLAVGLSAHHVLSARPQAAQIISRLSGGMMVLIAASLVVEPWLPPSHH